jgi:hypothetical protein
LRRLRKHRPSELGNKLGEASLEMAVSLYALADTLSALSCSKALSCRFAKAAHRIYGSTAVVFFKTIAYLDLPDENNKPYLARCSLREQVARAIAEWDQPGGDGAFFDKMSAAEHSSSISSFELGQVRMITYATADEAQHALSSAFKKRRGYCTRYANG